MTNTIEYQALVLVIDDDEVNRKVLEMLFKKENIRAVLAEDGKMGLIMAKEYMPDIILLDIFMPGEDGFEVLRQLKNDPKLSTIPVCIFSILEDQKRINKAYDMGACGYITKPFDMNETVVRVKEIIGGVPHGMTQARLRD